MFKIVKQGDEYALIYSAKNLTTGLSDVQAVPYNPSGVAQTPVALSEIATSGMYTAAFSTTAKALGVWTFKIDSASKPAPAITAVQIADPATLNDTLFEGLDTLLDSLTTNLATLDGKVDVIDGIVDTINTNTDTLEAGQSTIEGKIDTVDTVVDQLTTDLATVDGNVDDIEGIVGDGTHGNAALKTLIDNLQTAVSGLSNNSDAKVALIDQMLIPSAGSTVYKFFFRFYDADGNMEDPDDQDAGAEQAMVNVTVANSAGTDRSANLGGLSASTQDSKDWMTRVSEGVFSATYTIANTHAVEDLVFAFDVLEATNPKSFGAVSRAASSSDDYTSRFTDIDNALAVVDGNVDEIEVLVNTIDGKVDTIDTVVDGIQTDLDNGVDGLGALKTLIDAVQTDLDNGTDGLGAIKSVVDGNSTILAHGTYGLSALKTLLDTINSNTDGAEADLTAIKGSGWVAADNLHNISDLVKPGGIAL